MDVPLKLLVIEDSGKDVALEVHTLEAAGYHATCTVVETAAEMKAALASQAFDIVISDQALPQFDAAGALAVLKQSGPDIPFILVSGAIGEEAAVALLKAGAHDYVSKDRLSRLAVTVEHALQDAEDRRGRRQAEEALKASEEKYRLLVENAMEAIFIAADGMLIFTNHRTTELSGYSQEELFSKPFIEFIHPDDRQLVAERHFQRLKAMDVPDLYSFRITCKSRDIKWVELATALITWEGRPATLNFLVDVTDRRHLEEERQRLEKLESVGLLAAGIAHDFNNILTAILSNISLANMEAQDGSELQHSLEQAEKASLRAKDLFQQLLTCSKGEAPVLKLASLSQLLKDTAGFVLSGSNVKCRFSIPDDLRHAEIDAGQISQVIHNLVINAQQAMPSGGSIEISAENIALSKTRNPGKGLPLKEGDYISIAVTDHGIGIPAEHLEKIFDPFFTTRQKGSGLGLATSFSIARRHGGHISVESNACSGSTFYLYLPASTETAAPEQDKKEPIKSAGLACIPAPDDEQVVREVAGRLLKPIPSGRLGKYCRM
jgi:two-component system, cell cycle sensor histidine kinase and response regulator CckA